MNHPLILLGLILVAGIFSALGALVLQWSPWPGLRWSSLVAFVVCAMGGATAYAFAYDAIFGDASHALTSTTSLVLLLVSIPIVGSIAGWLGAAAVARLER